MRRIRNQHPFGADTFRWPPGGWPVKAVSRRRRCAPLLEGRSLDRAHDPVGILFFG